jgi:hypothetical protein
MKDDKTLVQILEELSLVLMYLTRFREEKDELWQAWKGYDWTILDNLQEKDYISFSYRAKRVYIQKKGLAKVQDLLKKYNVTEENDEYSYIQKR